MNTVTPPVQQPNQTPDRAKRIPLWMFVSVLLALAVTVLLAAHLANDRRNLIIDAESWSKRQGFSASPHECRPDFQTYCQGNWLNVLNKKLFEIDPCKD